MEKTNSVNGISSAALTELRKLRAIYPGAMLGGSSVYSPRREKQDWDFFIPTKDKEQKVEEKLLRGGFVLRYEYHWDEYIEGLGHYQEQTEIREGVESRTKFENLRVLKTLGRDFVLVRTGEDIREWMGNMQPILEQGALTDGEELFVIKGGESFDQATIDLTKIVSPGHYWAIKGRAEKMNRPINFIGGLSADVFETAAKEAAKAAAAAAETIKKEEKLRKDAERAERSALEQYNQYKKEVDEGEGKVLFWAITMGGLLISAVIAGGYFF